MEKELIEFLEKVGLKDRFIYYESCSIECSTLICRILIRSYNMKIPDHIHNRIILGDKNEWTEGYVRLSKGNN